MKAVIYVLTALLLAGICLVVLTDNKPRYANLDAEQQELLEDIINEKQVQDSFEVRNYEIATEKKIASRY